ncbi:hypothetical protein HGRIS_011961 [Hohenbuehelia grisea]|uniref:Uncharacterized protein n=1 Tax=Hohenbuehelia grisea TaxID=104357 RepID=A0ABR3JXN9_9AGAR
MLKTSAASGERSGGSVGFCFFTCHERVPLRSQAVVQIAAEGPEANPTHWTEYLPNGTSHTFGKITSSNFEHQSLWRSGTQKAQVRITAATPTSITVRILASRYHGGSKVTTDIILADCAITHGALAACLGDRPRSGGQVDCRLLKFDWRDREPTHILCTAIPTRLDLKRVVYASRKSDCSHLFPLKKREHSVRAVE